MDRHERIRHLFDCAMEQPPSIREQFVRSLVPNDSDLLDDLLGLIRAHRGAPAMLDEPLVYFGREAVSSSTPRGAHGVPSIKPGLCIGAYRMTRPIGAGGMSTVWLAERADGRFDYKVAVKLLGMFHSPALAKRFRTEQRALASLQHPFIARLIDAGNTESGIPYFIMEYVEGEPIDQYCRTRSLSINERLELFLKVCEAVSYAHRNMVIHRDLKPNNILVDVEDRPRLLDFGIAKLLRPSEDARLRSDSSTGMRSFTPDYASPEQWQGGAITPATDVYSLGAVLYELLAGCRLRTRYILNADQTYERAEPVLPPGEAHLRQTVATRAENPDNGKNRSHENGRDRQPAVKAADARSVYRQICGDIDHIVLKAVEFQPRDRYPTVEQFAEDIRRHLDCRPITARKKSGALYRARRFVHRNPGLIAGVGVAALGLVTAVIGATLGLF